MKQPRNFVPRGLRNNNPLNIRKGNNWQGERHPQTDPVFEEFESIQMGLRAGFKLIKNYISGFDGHRQPCNTIEKLISRWAPPVENATQNYIKFVADHTGIHERQTIWFSRRDDMIAIVRAMCYVECGQWLDTQMIGSAYDLL